MLRCVSTVMLNTLQSKSVRRKQLLNEMRRALLLLCSDADNVINVLYSTPPEDWVEYCITLYIH